MDAAPAASSRLTRRSAARAMAVAVGLAAGGSAARTAAQDADARHPLVGVWRVSAEPPGPPFGLAVYHADGTMSFATPSPAPAPPGSANALTHEAPAYGAWEATGERTAAMTGTHMWSDENGAFRGTLTFYATVQVDDSGDVYALNAVAETADPAGAVTGTFTAATRGTRVRVQPAPPHPEPASPSA